MKTIFRYLYRILDSLLPGSNEFFLVRGNLARRLLSIKGANNLKLGKGVSLGSGGDVLIGDDCTILDGCSFRVRNRSITLGRGCFIQDGCIFFAFDEAPIVIGSGVFIGTQSIIWTGSHEIGDEHQRAGTGTASAISIGDGCWLGIRSIIRANVGAGSIVNAGAIVVKPVEPNMLVQGVPALPVRSLNAGIQASAIPLADGEPG
jgi:acetyltransferase-like isoleucine patch superfamily enzyme